MLRHYAAAAHPGTINGRAAVSSEALLFEKKIPLPASVISRGKTSWDDIGIPLTTKIGCVLEILDPTGKAKEFQQVRVARDQNTQAVFSINVLHSYFHNRHMKPDSIALMEAWDAWESYLKALHEAR